MALGNDVNELVLDDVNAQADPVEAADDDVGGREQAPFTAN